MSSSPPPCSYRIVVDAGSTGSRLFAYSVDPSTSLVTRLGSKKVTPGLNAFVNGDSDDLTTRFMKLFDYATTVIPQDEWRNTDVSIMATAGMRLYTDDEQHATYEALYQGLKSGASRFEFQRLRRSDIATLSGTREGLYGAISTNYLSGMISPKLEFSPHVASPLGALDLGGSSTQIVFQPDKVDRDMKISGEDDFFVHSYLSYGADQMRERLWDRLLLREDDGGKDETRASGGTPAAAAAVGAVVANPCAFVGWEVEWRGRRLMGTGDSKRCAEDLLRVFLADADGGGGKGGDDDDDDVDVGLPNKKKKNGKKKQLDINGVRHPPVRGEFYAMSLFFFALDCVRELSAGSVAAESFVADWPSPTVNGLLAAAETFCGQSWADLEPRAAELHQYTRPDGLPHRCLEAVYIATLLKDAYGFDGDEKNITFVLHVNGMEVEWTLGYLMFDLNVGKIEPATRREIM